MNMGVKWFGELNSKELNSNNDYNVELWFFILATVGYFVVSGIAIPLGIDHSRFFSVPFRMIIFSFSLWIILRNYSWVKLKNISIISFLLFWIIYIVKLTYSLSNDFYDAAFIEKANEVYIRIIAIIVFPSLALMLLDYTKINFTKVFKAYFFILLVMLSFNLLYGLMMPYENFKLKFIFSMYYISYGHLGTLLSIISFYFLFFRIHFISKYFFYFGFLLGLITIVVGTARSPFLALAIVLLYLLLLNKKMKPILIFFSVIFGVLILFYLYKSFGFTEITFINRTNNWIFNRDTSLREPLYYRAFEIFKAKPIFGGRVLFENGFYPHNIFLELLMATGLIGFVLYFLKFIPVVSHLNLFFNPQNTNANIFFMLFLQYFILVLTSYSLFGVSEFLYFSAIIIGLVNSFKKKSLINN